MPEQAVPSVALARAKVNLTLHVGAPFIDGPLKGYHPLNSLVVFADIGDELSCQLADHTDLNIDGPFGQGLESNQDNLVLQAYEALSKLTDMPPLAFHLTKNLPVASGIGGGSADAAAALRLMSAYHDLPTDVMGNVALSLGADVPVCLTSKTAVMTNIGEAIAPVEGLGQVSAVLVNPGVGVSTGQIFKLFDQAHPDRSVKPSSGQTLLDYATNGTNDLMPAALSLEPTIQTALDRIEQTQGCLLSRMSGSGATCFGLYDDDQSAATAAQTLAHAYPDWWVKACRLGDMPHE